MILATLSNYTPVAFYNLNMHSEAVRRSEEPPELNRAPVEPQSIPARGLAIVHSVGAVTLYVVFLILVN